MRNFQGLALAATLAILPALIFACGDDPDADSPTAGAGPGSGAGTPTSTGMGGSTSSGGGNKPVEAVEGDITSNTTLTSDKSWLLKGVVRVKSGATLTIEPGTTIMGEAASKGSLIISQGGKIDAQGSADAPIVFTSELPPGSRSAGDWGGLVVLGRAPINEPGGTSQIEGYSSDELFGGSDPADNSGIMSYLRIEFSGIEISADNEINGLTFGGVGSGTQVHHIMVRHTLDDCFEFFGGTVNAKNLVCYRNGDDGFDFDEGYIGKLQFLFLAQDPSLADDTHGFESDNDESTPDATPVTHPTIYNVTLCGQNNDQAKQQYGFLFRRGFNATIGNAIVTGFEAGVDFRDKPYTDVTLTSSIFFGNLAENVAYAEDGSNADTEADDDNGFDEVAWFQGGFGNSEADPMLADCFAATPDPRPAATIPGEAPPNDGFFDETADYIGAFRDGSDDWMTGAWVDWSAN
jgi:hypothetical protein